MRRISGGLNLNLIFRAFTSRRYGSNLSYYNNADPFPLLYRTVGQQLEAAARKYPNSIAISSFHENKAFTFPEVLDRADKLAAGLANLGMRRGDFVGLWMPNTINWYIAMMGIARLGGVCVALNPAFQAPEIEYCIQKVGMKGIITVDTYKTQKYHGMLEEVVPELRMGETKITSDRYTLERVIVDSSKKLSGALNFNDVCKVSDSEATQIQVSQDYIQPDDGCNLQFTSGTTGKPKAALLSHYSIVNNGFHIGHSLDFNTKQHKICLNIPLFHAYALVVALSPALEYGASIYLPNPGFDVEASIKCIHTHGCTYTYGTPTMYVDLVAQLKRTQEKMDSLEFAVTGGASISPTLLQDMKEFLGVERVRSIFGMTETVISFQSLSDESGDRVLNSVGKVMRTMEAKVVDAEGRMVPFGVPGELWVRGYGTMLGYFGDDAKTRETIGPDRWLRTGDQFVLHEDGYGQIVGRLKEMIIRGGENIFPKEIEDFLGMHPSISEVFIVGVPDERMGEEVAAFVKLVPGVNNLTHEEVKDFCKGRIAHFKVPKYVKIVKEFPKTASGKIQKFKLVETFNDKKSKT